MFSVISCYQLMDECSVFLMSVIAVLNFKIWWQQVWKNRFLRTVGFGFGCACLKLLFKKPLKYKEKLLLDARKNAEKPGGRGCPKFYQILSKSQSVRLLSQSIEKSLVINALRHFLIHRQSRRDIDKRRLKASFCYILTKICGRFVEWRDFKRR